MKKVPFLSLISGILLAGITSCSTSVISDDPDPVNPESETKTLNIRVVSNDFTRAGETDIQSLYLAFYKGVSSTPLYLEEAQLKDAYYSVDLPIDPFNIPDRVVAFANFADKETLSTALESPTIDHLGNTDGSLYMSSAVYFNGDELINSSPVTSDNINNRNPIEIYLDRLAAKVTVEKASDATITAPNITGSDNLTLDIIGWGLTATDKSSYLLKQVSDNFSTFNWAVITDKPYSFSWAKSVNYGSDILNVNKIKLDGIQNDLSSPLYAHESTRNSNDLKKSDSKPSLIIVGQYKEGNENKGTFYRLRSGKKDQIFSETDFLTEIMKNQDFLFSSANKTDLAVYDDIKEYIKLTTPTQKIDEKDIPNYYVCPQYIAKEGTDNKTFYKKDGNEYTQDELNALLYDTYPLLEKYLDGKCIFIVPIIHHSEGDNTIYGLVRNHTYKLTIKNISGFGRGVGSNDTPISDDELSNMKSTYTINSTLNVNQWIEKTQEIDIPASK